MYFIGMVVALFSSTAMAGVITLTNPNDNAFYRVELEPQYGHNYDYDYVAINMVNANKYHVQTDDFWSDANQLWIGKFDGIGSVHTFDLEPMPTLIHVSMENMIGISNMRYIYSYYYGATISNPRKEEVILNVGPIGSVPEPSTLGMVGVALLGLIRRKR